MHRAHSQLAAAAVTMVVVGFMLFAAPANAATEGRPYQVGVARVDVTPGYPVRLNGFGGRRDESEGVTQRIWAKALAIDEGDDHPVVLITLDSLGIRQTMVDEVARRLHEKCSLDRDRIVVAFSHSHTTPKVAGACDTIFSSPIPPEHQEHIDRYTEELTNCLEQVAVKALADRKPATLAWAVGSVRFAMNRRTPGGPVDHDLPVLVVRSADGGDVRAIYTTYACHCVTLSDNKISGDWAGYAQHEIEAKHRGAIAMVSIGCGSDSNPNSGVTGANYAAAAEQGSQIADEVDRLLGGQLRPITGGVAATFAKIDLPLEPPPTAEELQERAKRPLSDPVAFNAQYQLARLERGEPLLEKLDYPVQTISFGDSLSMVFLGGEVCVDYALRLKQELDASRLWLHGYSNDFCAYIPSERLLKEGGYGGGAEIHYFGLPSTLKAGLEDRIIDKVQRQIPKQLKLQTDAARKQNAERGRLKQALASTKVKDGFVVEIAAAEPLVADPVAIDFGPDGRMWVAEMPDYTRYADDEFEPSGNVRVLADRDGDGRFDEATIFAEGLRFPTDVKFWRCGVIVCDAPEVIYFEDADGDGKADRRTVLLSGFDGHSTQARVNSLRWGLDNWLYGSGGLFGGQIKSHTGRELALGDRDFRFRPDTGEIEPVTGRTQQGRARNEWGDWFGCENGSLVDHYPLVDRYMARNPLLAPPATEVFVPVGDDPNQLYPIGTPSVFALSGPAARPTSACGLELYRDNLLGAEFTNNAFVAEPVNNLVHRLVLSASGTTFEGERAEGEQQAEFLASTDSQFRPVQIRTGTDGCLYIVDMHREVIEHPEFIPEAQLKEVNLMGGREEGRIFRVRPRSVAARRPVRLDHLTAEGLAAALDSPNGPQRDLAQQLLIERRAVEAAPMLKQLAQTSPLAAARLQALCTLDGLQAVDADVLAAALADQDAAVRRHAIRIAEPLLAAAPSVASAVLQLAADGDPQVRLQLAYTLGELDDPRAAAVLATMAVGGQSDPYLLSAVWSSVHSKNVAAVVQQIIARAGDTPLDPDLVDTAVMLLVELGRPAEISAAAKSLSGGAAHAEPWKLAAAARLLGAGRTSVTELEQQLGSVIAQARGSLDDPDAEEPTKLAALRVVAASRANRQELTPVLERLLEPQNPPSIQRTAIELLGATPSPQAAESVLAHWGTYTTEVRATAFDVIAGKPELIKLLLDRIAAGAIKPSDLNALERQRLLDRADEGIRKLAQAALAGAIDADRQRIVDQYVAEFNPRGDVERGRQVFARHCASCHQLEDVGHAVGPDLAALTSRQPQALLQSILDPNRDIDDRFRCYTAVTVDGLSHAGILAEETSTSITLMEQQGKRHTLLRADLELFENSGKSLMPEGLERDLSPSDAADLLAYMAANGPEAKRIEGNAPVVATPDYDGALWLMAASAKIYGGEITYEGPFHNIGFWHGQNDYVAWQVKHPAGGEFEAYLHWACAEDAAGSRFVLEGGARPLRGVVKSTGGYDQYQTVSLGRTELAPGTTRIVLRPDGPLATANLMDLRGVYLVPRGASPERAIAGQAPPTRPDAAEAIAKLLDGLAVGTPDEYERIPAIWQEAIAAGRRNNAGELVRVVDLALPKEGEPLHDWQAVVIGGGVVNGVSSQRPWPGARISELLEGLPQLKSRWERTIDLAADMADDENVATGTRYDALRILGADAWDRRGSQLSKYLAPDAHAELQMGAVSGAADMDSPRTAEALIAALPHLQEANRRLAVQGLLRTPQRRHALAAAVESHGLDKDLLTAEELAAIAAP